MENSKNHQVHSHKQANSNNLNNHSNHDKHKQKDHFTAAIVGIALLITISLIALKTGGSQVTGYAVSSANENAQNQALREFNDVKSLGTLAPGNYYIDGSGVVYWMDDESMPAVGKLTRVDESQKSRNIFIDNDGRVGYTAG